MEKCPTKKLICLLAQIAVTPALCQPALYADGKELPVRSPVMSTEKQTLVRREPKFNQEWTWITADHANHILKSSGYSNLKPLVRYKAHWQGIVTKDAEQKIYYSWQPLRFVSINRYGDVSTYRGSDIVQRWPMFSAKEVSALKDREDLIEQIHVKYDMSRIHAAIEVETFLKGRGF